MFLRPGVRDIFTPQLFPYYIWARNGCSPFDAHLGPGPDIRQKSKISVLRHFAFSPLSVKAVFGPCLAHCLIWSFHIKGSIGNEDINPIYWWHTTHMSHSIPEGAKNMQINFCFVLFFSPKWQLFKDVTPSVLWRYSNFGIQYSPVNTPKKVVHQA